ncbi:hypothetical protein D027_0933A, partial [Vibrio parahaemolyticus 861]
MRNSAAVFRTNVFKAIVFDFF